MLSVTMTAKLGFELEHKVATKSWRVPGTLGSNGTITEGMVVLRIFSFHGG
jgi:hypothetical protein